MTGLRTNCDFLHWKRDKNRSFYAALPKVKTRSVTLENKLGFSVFFLFI